MPSRFCIHYVSKSGRPSSGLQDWKRSIFIPILKKGNTKECDNHQIIAVISHASKVMLKIWYARLQHCVNLEFPGVQAGFRKEELEIKLPTFTGLQKKQGNFRKTPISVSLTTPKPLTVQIMTNYGQLLQRWEYQIILSVS